MPATPAKPLEIDRPRQLAALASPARQEVVDAIKRGGPPNGAVEDPDVMTRVRVKADG